MKTFSHGGVHPPEMKHLSKDVALEKIAMPKTLILPVLQHIGSPAKSIVSVGDLVKKGQVLAEASGYVSVPVHAPTSGEVSAIVQRAIVSGKVCDHIVIEADGQEEWLDGILEKREWQSLDGEEIKEIIKNCGVVGLGGAAFPTHVKLSPPEDKPIDVLILNGVECEPYMTCDYRVMIDRTKAVAIGLRIMMKALGVEKAIIGVEANKPDAFEKMRDAVWSDSGITAEMLKVKYPQGAEKQLIEALLGREVSPGKLPFDVGVVVQNVGTALAVYEAVCEGKPLIERAVTVTGEGVEKPANLVVPIGTSVADLLLRQGVDRKTKKLVMGGPMMGIALPSADIPVVKGTSGILAFNKTVLHRPGPCIRCGKCIEVCPLHGMAAEMVAAIEAGQVEKYEHLHVLDCVECGTCTFACPSHRSLVHYIKRAKAEYMAWKSEQSKKK
ncbi:MAG TPA: electron transport complex subunit RsxC [bacterium]|nr:MAG: Electron transport complex protein RnfC [bacterium ADurb.Bin270]HPW46065.1 electron transport complex subunit RsxC [bacterium]